MKRLKNLPIYLSVFLFLVIINLQVVYATSETLTLSVPPTNPTTRVVELQKGDRLVGYYTLTNLQTWTTGYGATTYFLAVLILDPMGQPVHICSPRDTKGDSFDYTAWTSGVYKIQFEVCFDNTPPSGIENPQATLNYNVVSASQSIPSPSETSTSGNPLNPLIQFSIIMQAAAISIGIAIVALVVYYVKKRK